MKRYLILTILFCLYLLPTYGTYYNSNTNNYNRYNGISTQQTIETRRIGYSTNYGHGFNKMTQTAPMYRGTTFGSTSYYRGTYTPTYGGTTYGSSGSGRPGIRKVTVYNGNGETAQTPGGTNDPEGVYQYDSSTDTWYYSPDGGSTWYEYRKASGLWELFIGLFGGGWGEQWRTVNHQQTENTTNWATDPDDPFLDPIGDCPYWMLFSFLLMYITYKKYNSLTVKRKIC